MKTKSPHHPASWTTAQWVIFVAVLFFLLLLTVGLRGQTPPELPNVSEQTFSQNKKEIDRVFIDKLAKEYVSFKGNSALVIGVIKNGQKTSFTYGETEKGNKTLPDVNSIFELGQASEVFTTSLLAILESEGKISSHEAVQDVLKGVVKVPYYQRIICQRYTPQTKPDNDFQVPFNICFPDPNDAPKMIVLCDLATHSSGLPEEPSTSLFAGKNRFKDYTLDRLNNFVGKLSPSQTFGFEYQHSMVGIALLGEAMAFKLKTNYSTLLQTKLLNPLSMKHTFTTPTTEQAQFFLIGHTPKGKITPHRDYNALTPAAGIRSSVPDLLTFIEANINPKMSLNVSLKETHIPRIYTDFNNPDYYMGWGWIQSPLYERDSKNKKKMLWQVSERGGFSVYMSFVKESGTAVVIMSNSANAVDGIGREILKSLEITPEKSKTVSAGQIKN